MKLQDLETRLQTIIEERLTQLLAGQQPERVLIHKLTESMYHSAQVDGKGSRAAPNVYTLLVHPDAIHQWKDPALLETLAEILKTAAEDSGLRFESPPTLTLAENPALAADGFEIVASHKIEKTEKTQDMQVEAVPEDVRALPENAFLIVEGVKVFQLKQVVVNIGRRLDNGLVIDDPRVSRTHAQLRAIRGRFVLFDLNSSGGTFVNGQRTTQSVLYPGDVISLAGVSLIFGQDNAFPRRDLPKTGPQSPASAERGTAIIHTMPLGLKKKK